ncbi:hypothetical protein GGF43_003348, partial [Coemansia sp. RSA 2618]
RICSEVELAQLEACPELMERLALALDRAGLVAKDHARVGEALVELVARVNRQMAETQEHVSSKSKGKGVARTEQLAANAQRGVRLTPLHIECLKQSLLAQRRDLHERVMRDVVLVRLDAIGHLLTKPKARSFMEYHLYAGMVCVGVDEFELATRMWQLVFALPAKHASAIQVAAYKRLLLLSLATSGQKARLPTFFANSHARVLESNAMAYVALADQFSSKLMSQAVIKIQDMQGQLERDGNWALAMRLVNMMPRHFIKRVGSAYASLGIQQLMDITGFSAHPLASRASDPYAALVLYIREMNDDSVVVVQSPGAAARTAVVNFSDARATMSMVSGHDSTAAQIQNEQQWAELIESKVRQIDELQQYLTKLDHHLALTKEYISSSRDQSTSI